MLWWGTIFVLVVVISYFHMITPPDADHIHLILMQAYFIPILLGAFQLGVKGGLGSALMVSAIFTPHVMFQWVGDFEHNLLALLQMVLFNVIGYLTGLKAQKEEQEKLRYRRAAGKLEASLQQLKVQSAKVSELEEQLRRSDRLAIVGELTASLAHELRNPLATIRGIAEILNDELPPEIKKGEFFPILIAETERMSAVVENYLNFARKQTDRKSRFDVREVVENTCQILAHRAQKAGIRIEADLPGHPVRINGDANDLRQVLVNLLLNAVEAMSSPGEIHLSVKIEKPDTPQAPERVRLSIKDQGSGIDAETLQEIFKPFYTTKSNGTGLGLSIVKRIAEQYHWEIAVESTPGKGSEFVLFIPTAAATTPQSATT
jgi:signal transduction histidine kinase